MAENTSDNSEQFNESDWLRIREIANVGPMQIHETGTEKLVRKVRENPFVPLGCTATVCALCYGLYNLYKGRSQMSQYMMRARVLAQAFTFVAILTGLALNTKKKNQ